MKNKGYSRELKKLGGAYRKISKLAGIKFEEAVNESYGLVIKKNHELYGKIGIYDYLSYFPKKIYLKFKGKAVSRI